MTEGGVGMTLVVAGITVVIAGMTVVVAGMTVVVAGRTDYRFPSASRTSALIRSGLSGSSLI